LKAGDDTDDNKTERAELVHASKAWMLGPKGENQDFIERLFLEVFRDCCYWRRNFHPEDDPFVTLDDRRSLGFQRSQEALREQLGQMIARLKSGVPFFNPRYVGHMLTDQFIAGFLGYAAAMFHNQNTLAQELAPVTLEFEGEGMQLIGTMLGLNPEKGWGHLCCGGTTANMEALWVARNLRLFPYLLRAAVDQLSGSYEQQDQKHLQTLRGLSVRHKPFVDWADAEQLRTLTIDELLSLHKQLKEACGNDISLAAFVQKWSPVRLGMANMLGKWVGKQLAGMELKHLAREFIRYEAPYLNEAEQQASQEEGQKAGVTSASWDNVLEQQAEDIKKRVPWYEGKMSEYTLEGSRPGASAAAVWLAHKTIPLNQEGHGAMVGQTVLGTWRLIKALQDNLRVHPDKDGIGYALLCEKPDLNIICYTFPSRSGGAPVPLAVVNQAVRKLYDEFLPDSRHPMPTRDFVIAKTALSFSKYGCP
jgi:hypothetical protein